MDKARSRLKKPESNHSNQTTPKTGSLAKIKLDPKGYLTHLPTLLVSLPFWLVTAYILTNLQPDSLKNMGLPNSYLPFLIITTIAIFFTASYLFLNTRRGFLLSLGLGTALFLRLQQVENNIFFAIVILGFLIFIEVFISWLKKIKKD